VASKDRKGKKGAGKPSRAKSEPKKSLAGAGIVPEPHVESPPDWGLGPLDSPIAVGFGEPRTRLDQIRESHAFIRQFTPKELKILMALKRNTSPKAWTLREDLMVLTLPLGNRELAEILKDRNKEAVKKRLQLLRSKGLNKRPRESPSS
jgi:hypothetical protein